MSRKYPMNISKRLSVKSRSVVILVTIAVASVLIHLILRSSINGSALLYVGIPFLISMILLVFTDKNEKPTWKQKFKNHLRDAFIIMMASSVILFEGFVCVLMFIPIYLSIILIVFIVVAINKKYKSRIGVHALPIVIVVLSLEGTHPDLSFNRYNEVSSTSTVNRSIAGIKANLIRPVNLEDERVWFLDIFPMPYEVDNHSLIEGATHTILYRYHRWFVANTHEGETILKIVEVDDAFIRTEFIKDTSYISHYMKLHGTEIQMKALSEQSTQVTLTIKYDRLLDPAWYFGPLQKYAIEKTASYLISKMML